MVRSSTKGFASAAAEGVCWALTKKKTTSEAPTSSGRLVARSRTVSTDPSLFSTISPFVVIEDTTSSETSMTETAWPA